MLKRFAVVRNNKVTEVRITHDINHLKDNLGKDCDIIELTKKKVKVGQTWSHFPTFKKIISRTKSLFTKKPK